VSHQILNNYVIHDGPDEWEYEKGILSGWRWTAFLDTMYNRAMLETAARLVPDAAILSSNAQGDDTQVELRDVYGAHLVVAAYAALGFFVNPKKFFISRDRDEYLRQVYTQSFVAGYPARAINGILWRNPIVADPPVGPTRLSEVLNAWLIFYSRTRGLEPDWEQVIQDMSGASRIAKHHVRNWIYTPASMGGGGLQPHTRTPVTFEPIYPDDDPPKTRWEYGAQQDFSAYFARQGILTAPVPPQLSSLDAPIPERYVTVNLELPPRYEPHYVRFGKTEALTQPVYIHDPETDDSRWSQFVDLCVRDWNLDPIVAKMTFESITIHKRLSSHATKRVHTIWLLGKLPFSPPRDVQYGMRWASVIHKTVSKRAFAFLLRQNKISINSLISAAVQVEVNTLHELKELTGDVILGY
jgi:hypothetical protein